jgi:hypothetical protein
MTKRLEEEFNLPPIDESDIPSSDDIQHDIVEVEDAISISEKINSALSQVRGMEAHDGEMDEIAREAMESYQALMSLGMNMTDMAAGPVLNNAATMLKIALEAKDSKVTRKLKQIDLMLKKANLDQRDTSRKPEAEDIPAQALDRNDLLKMLSKKDSDSDK